MGAVRQNQMDNCSETSKVPGTFYEERSVDGNPDRRAGGERAGVYFFLLFVCKKDAGITGSTNSVQFYISGQAAGGRANGVGGFGI